MTVDRDIWKDWFKLGEFNALPCPTCHIGHLMTKSENVYEKETNKSRASIDKRNPNPFDYEGRFYILLRCANCNDHTHVIGKSAYNVEYAITSDGDVVPEYITIYSPAAFHPTPNLLNFSEDIPQGIIAELILSYSLFWQDYSACGNRIRVSVEMLLDSFGVPKFKRNKQPIMLHERIIEFKKRNSSFAHVSDQLMAIKWLGNAASHTIGLTKDDIFDALDLLEYVLEEIYKGRKDKVEKLAKKIIKKKGSIYKKKT